MIWRKIQKHIEIMQWDSNWERLFDGPRTDQTLGINFVRAQEKDYHVMLKHHKIQFSVQQNLSRGVGGIVWDCALAQVSMLDQYPEYIQGKTVLEVGSGTGVVGISALFFKPKKVLLTDLAAQLDQIQTNVDMVKSQHVFINEMYRSGSIQVAPLDWTVSKMNPKVQETILDVEVILGSDCLYEKSIFPSFLNILKACSGGKKNLVIFLTMKLRIIERERSFLTQLNEAGFHIQIATDATYPEIALLRLNVKSKI